MRKYQHINQLVQKINSVKNKTEFTDLIMEDLKDSSCMIYAETIDEEPILLAELITQPNTIELYSGLFQQRIDFIVEGKIINDQYPAIKYCVKGTTIQFSGRCSTIPQVCGVDLYLDKSYTGRVGDDVKQKFSIPVSKLYKSI